LFVLKTIKHYPAKGKAVPSFLLFILLSQTILSHSKTCVQGAMILKYVPIKSKHFLQLQFSDIGLATKQFLKTRCSHFQNSHCHKM